MRLSVSMYLRPRHTSGRPAANAICFLDEMSKAVGGSAARCICPRYAGCDAPKKERLPSVHASCGFDSSDAIE